MSFLLRLLALGACALAVMGQSSCVDTSEVNTRPSGRKWTAFAYDRHSGAWGLGWNHFDRHNTVEQALSNCGRSGCAVVEVSQSRCIAFAHSQRPATSGYGHAETPHEAEHYALNSCRNSVSGASCHVQAVRCSEY
jgi:hypothetical protein